MKLWLAFESWWPGFVTDKYVNLATWIGHGVMTVLIILPFAAFGHPWTGFCSGVTAYGLRELEDALDHGVSWDTLGDIGGPVVFGLLVVWLI